MHIRSIGTRYGAQSGFGQEPPAAKPVGEDAKRQDFRLQHAAKHVRVVVVVVAVVMGIVVVVVAVLY